MFKVQQNRYLWVHLVGLAAVPLLLDICLAGLASAGSAFQLPAAFGLQFWLVAIVCIVPPAVMQIQRPFYIYSLPPLAVKPSSLSEDDRRCLTVLKSWQIKALAGLTAAFSLWLLARLYDKLPQVLPAMEPKVGLISAIAAFFFACLFLQISASVVRSLLIGQDTLQRVKPFEISEIAANFSILGLRVRRLLPSTNAIANEVSANSPIEAEEKEPTAGEAATKKLIETEEEKAVESISQPLIETDESSDVEDETSEAEILSVKTESSGVSTNPIPVEPIPIDTADTPIEAENAASAEAAIVPEEPPLVIPELIESDDSNEERKP